MINKHAYAWDYYKKLYNGKPKMTYEEFMKQDQDTIYRYYNNAMKSIHQNFKKQQMENMKKQQEDMKKQQKEAFLEGYNDALYEIGINEGKLLTKINNAIEKNQRNQYDKYKADGGTMSYADWKMKRRDDLNRSIERDHDRFLRQQLMQQLVV